MATRLFLSIPFIDQFMDLESTMTTLTFKQKMWLPLICALICLTGIAVFDALQLRRIGLRRSDALAFGVARPQRHDLCGSGVGGGHAGEQRRRKQRRFQ